MVKNGVKGRILAIGVLTAQGALAADPLPSRPGDMWNVLNKYEYEFHEGYSDEFTSTAEPYGTPDPLKWKHFHPTSAVEPNHQWLSGMLDILVYDWLEGEYEVRQAESFYYADYSRAWEP